MNLPENDLPLGKPLLGALDLYIDNHLIYTKRKHKNWPKIGLIFDRLKQYKSDKNTNFYPRKKKHKGANIGDEKLTLNDLKIEEEKKRNKKLKETATAIKRVHLKKMISEGKIDSPRKISIPDYGTVGLNKNQTYDEHFMFTHLTPTKKRKMKKFLFYSKGVDYSNMKDLTQSPRHQKNDRMAMI